MKSLLCILFLFLSLFAKAEGPKGTGKLAGIILDSLNKKPVEYAAISLLKQSTGKIINGTTADEKGHFGFDKLDEEEYTLYIDFVGYRRKILRSVHIGKDQPAKDLGNIYLAPVTHLLKELNVTEEKNVIENKIDKLVFNVEKDLTSQTGMASDVLKKVPQVSVDIDGNVELQGNSNIKFLINGKPSVIFGSNIAEVLKAIPASQIKSIEVISSPGARYDAEGTGGIINIILKKDKIEGVNGNVSLTGGTRLQSGSMNLNMKKGNVSGNLFFSGNGQLKSRTLTRMERESSDQSTVNKLVQDGLLDYTRKAWETGAGVEWDLSPKDNISASAGMELFTFHNSGSAERTSTSEDSNGTPTGKATDNILTDYDMKVKSLDIDVAYKRQFEQEDHELELSFNTSLGNNSSEFMQSQASGGKVYNASRGENPGQENETILAADYTLPLGEEMKLETGVKTEHIYISSEANIFLYNQSAGNYEFSHAQSAALNYTRDVYAGYASLNMELFDKLKTQAGLRLERTSSKADFSQTGNVFLKPYNTLVPSVILNYPFSKDQGLKIAYTRRIERPDYHDLNPFLNASDPRNISTGNPGLRPEFGNKIELTWHRMFSNKAVLNTTLFYRGNRDDIQSYTRLYPVFKIGDSTYTNVAVTLRDNIGKEDNFGMNVFLSWPVSEKISLRSNISAFERYIFTGISNTADVHGFNYRLNLNISCKLSQTLAVEGFGNFNSPRINAQGTLPSFTTYNLALRKDLFHEKASIALSATNFLNEYVDQYTKLKGENFSLNNLRQLPYRSFGINFTYRFGSMEMKKDKEDPNLSAPPMGN